MNFHCLYSREGVRCIHIECARIEFIVTNNLPIIREFHASQANLREGILSNNSLQPRLPEPPLGHLSSESTEVPQPTRETERARNKTQKKNSMEKRIEK